MTKGAREGIATLCVAAMLVLVSIGIGEGDFAGGLRGLGLLIGLAGLAWIAADLFRGDRDA